MSKDKCTNNTGFSFSSGNGTSMGWDTNGTPCQITNKSKGTSFSSNFSKVNTSTIVDQYIINPNSQNFGSGNPSQNSGSMGFSQLMSEGNHSTNTNMPNVISSAYNEELQGKSFALNKRQEMGETYTLPYDDKGNLLSGTQLRDKYDALFKTDKPFDSEASHKKMLNYIKEIEEEKKQQKLEKNTTFKKPVSSDKQDLQIKSSTYQNQFEDKAKKEFEALEREIREEMLNPAIVNAEQEKRYAEISETLASLGISDINPSQKKIEKPVITNVKNDDKSKQSDQEKLTQDLSDKYGKVYVGTTSSFVKKAGDSENADLKSIHFTYGLEGITSISGGCGYGTMVYLPINDDYIDKAIPALSMFNLNYLSIQNSKVGNKGITLLMNANLCIKEWNLSNNNINDEGAEIISHALITGSLSYAKDLNLADNNITDTGAGYLAQSFKSEGNKLKVLHLEGNKLNPLHTNSKLIQVVTNMKTHVKILVSRMSDIVDGVKKQGNLFFGSKEDKQAIIKDILKQAQENGVDVKNVTVSKDIFEVVKNLGQLTFNFSVGWVKCKLVPDSVKSFAADQIIAKASPLVGQINTVMDVANCYFESFDENASSQQGVQFIGDLGFITQSEFFGVNE